MRKAIAFSMFAALAVAAMVSSCDANAKQIEPAETCLQLAQFAKSLMEARQSGLPIKALLDTSKDPNFIAMVASVYMLPRGSSAAEQDAVTKRFALGVYAECLAEVANTP